jgi:hypothetical protein
MRRIIAVRVAQAGIRHGNMRHLPATNISDAKQSSGCACAVSSREEGSNANAFATRDGCQVTLALWVTLWATHVEVDVSAAAYKAVDRDCVAIAIGEELLAGIFAALRLRAVGAGDCLKTTQIFMVSVLCQSWRMQEAVGDGWRHCPVGL